MSSSSFFQLRARLAGRSGDLKPGTYALARDMSTRPCSTALEQGLPPNVVSVTIPEGRSRREVAPLVKSLPGNYVKATRRNPDLDPRDYGAKARDEPRGLPVPGLVRAQARARACAALVDEQLDAFKRNFGKVDMRYARSKNLTRYDVLIIASLVEREAAVPKERQAHRLGDLQPPARRHPARHRRHHALRRRQVDRARCASPSCRTRTRTTRGSTRACRRGRSAARAWPRSRPPPTRRRPTTSSTWQARAATAAPLRAHRRRVPALRGRLQPRRASSAAASRRPSC